MNGYLRNLAKRTLRTTPPLHPQSRLPFSGASGYEPEVPLEEPAEGRAGDGSAIGEGREAGPGPMGAEGNLEDRPSTRFPSPDSGTPPEERAARDWERGMEGGPTAEPFPGGSVVPERGRPLGDPLGDLLEEGRALGDPARNLVKEGRPLQPKQTAKEAAPAPSGLREEPPFAPPSARGRAWESAGEPPEFLSPDGEGSPDVRPPEERRFQPLLGERPVPEPAPLLPDFPEAPVPGQGLSAGTPEAPDIHVSIGRIEVSAVTSAPSPKKTAPTGPGVMSLKEYEEKRWRRSR